MADLGNTSMAGTADKHKLTSWITVLLLIVSSIVLGFAFVLQSIPLAVIGGLIGIAGLVCGVVFKIMDDVH